MPQVLYIKNISFKSSDRFDFVSNVNTNTTPLTASQSVVIGNAPLLFQVLMA
jgi:hypothetical protein